MTTDRTPDEIRIELQRVHRRMRILLAVTILDSETRLLLELDAV